MHKAFQTVSIYLYRLTTLGLSKGPHFTRYYMYTFLSKYSKPRSKNLKLLSISHSQKLAKLLGFTDNQITDAAYPEFNILNLPFKDGQFDAVVSNQVLEHVNGNPQRAIDETFRVLKPNGIVLHTTCFIMPLHGCPNDYWRFSPEALKLLVANQGDIVDIGGWGNLYVWLLSPFGLHMQPVPHARWHPAHWIATKNSADWPLVTWILVRKKAA